MNDICGIDCLTLAGWDAMFCFDPWAMPTAIQFNRCAVKPDYCPVRARIDFPVLAATCLRSASFAVLAA